MICAVVLAAGRSERMGAQKLLLSLGGKTVIARVADELLRSYVEKLFVVIGKDGERLQEVLVSKPVHFVENPDLTSDMLGSVKCGLRALPKACDAVLVVLGDQPGISHNLANDLIRCFRGRNGKIIVPICHGRRGHPVLLGSQCIEQLLNYSDGEGLRGFLGVHASDVFSLAVASTAVLEDMDTPADYQRQQTLFANPHADTVSPP